MNKKTLRSIALVMVLVALLACVFVGCGKKDKETTTTASTTTSVTDTSSSTAAVRHVNTAPARTGANLTATRPAVTETTAHQRPTGTTAASVIQNGEAAGEGSFGGQTSW